MLYRNPKNPLITPKMIEPSAEGLQVVGAFNPAAVQFNDEIILIIRVAETTIKKKDIVSVPYFKFTEGKSKIEVLDIPERSPDLTLKDTRGIFYKGKDYLSSLSHLRLARSKDGINFKVDEKPFILPADRTESFGVEDARISKINDEYYINYTIVSGDGYATFLSKTKDFKNIERLGIIFSPLNKDVCIFEEKVKGKYIALHRPDNHGFGLPSIWYAESPDLIHWGNHKCLLRPNGSKWETQKIGAGAPPVKTEYGWLVIYHAKGENNVYSLNLILLDLKYPDKIIALSKEPFMFPETKYEKEGFFGNVVFTNGHVVLPDGTINIYYGTSDEYTCMAQTSINELLNLLN
ncbi:MAG: glycoside hydrolase family 130 protein [Bacteroidales bacterium]|nr:glycoside hydrolase family 130 protein [Bacteroidales bacterium]